MGMEHKALEVHGLNKNYEGFSLRDVSFEIPKGYIMGFIGPNGAGKTTTIKAILDLIQYSSGEIRLLGRDTRDKTAQVNEGIGVVMDAPLYVEDWTMSDVEAAVAPFYRHWDRQVFAQLLKKFEIDRKKKVKALSRGMKVKLMIAVALSHKAELLILDEPTSGLDPVARDELCEMLADFVTDENKSVLFSTHITADLEKIADYITFILDGHIVFSGTKETLLEKYVLVKGGAGDIDARLEKRLIGRREYTTGFEGLAESAHAKELPKDCLIEPATLDEIILYMNRGKKQHG